VPSTSAARGPSLPQQLNWSAIVASLSFAFALIVTVLAWIVTHPHKTPQPPEMAKLSVPSPTVEVKAEPASPPVSVVPTVPVFHRIEPPQHIVANLPPIDNEPPPPLPPPPSKPKAEEKPPVVAAPPAMPPAPIVPAGPAGETYGTQVLFLNNPAAAREQAREEMKLVFVMHISGNFEDSCFT
jgi:hypothetical protein